MKCLGAKSFGQLGIGSNGSMTLCITIPSITIINVTLSIITVFIMLSVAYAKCHVFDTVTLSFII